MESREYKITKKVSIKDTTEQTIDNNALSLESLLKKVTSLSKDKNPYKVYKEIEEIKSIFYIKLNIANNESNKHKENEEETNKEIIYLKKK